jgi:hypothetical protein
MKLEHTWHTVKETRKDPGRQTLIDWGFIPSQLICVGICVAAWENQSPGQTLRYAVIYIN